MSIFNLVNTIVLVACLSGCGAAPAPSEAGSVSSLASIQADPGLSDPLPATPVPVPVATPVPTPVPTPVAVPATVVAYGYFNSNGICAALRAWNPATTTITFPANSAGDFIYTFAQSGITIANADGSAPGLLTGTITKDGAIHNPPVCTITVDMGHLTSVN